MKCKELSLLYRGSNLWVNAINAAIFLNSSHCFVDDPEYGEISMRMWLQTFTKDDCERINQRVIGATLTTSVQKQVTSNSDSTGISVGEDLINDDQECTTSTVQLPTLGPDADIAYACHTNAEKTAIHASIFQKHIAEFPKVESEELPPCHTLVIEADIMRAPKRKPKGGKTNHQDAFHVRVTKRICEKIYSKCGDSDMMDQRNYIDPALKLYRGAHCMINDNEDIASGRGNGTLCRIVSVKLRKNVTPKIRNYDNKKVYAVNARDVEYIECEHFPKKVELMKMEKKLSDVNQMLVLDPQNQNLRAQSRQLKNDITKHIESRRFKLTTKKYYCTFCSDLISSNDIGLLRVAGRKKDQQ